LNVVPVFLRRQAALDCGGLTPLSLALHKNTRIPAQSSVRSPRCQKFQLDTCRFYVSGVRFLQHEGDFMQLSRFLSPERRSPRKAISYLFELHHRGQSPQGPLDEMTSATHDAIPHPISPSQIDRVKFAGERARYWRQRVRILLGQE